MITFVVQVVYSSAVYVRKIESAISKHGEIITLMYLNAPDKNGYWTPRDATYIVITKNPRVLKITLTQLDKQIDSNISYFQVT